PKQTAHGPLLSPCRAPHPQPLSHKGERGERGVTLSHKGERGARTSCLSSCSPPSPFWERGRGGEGALYPPRNRPGSCPCDDKTRRRPREAFFPGLASFGRLPIMGVSAAGGLPTAGRGVVPGREDVADKAAQLLLRALTRAAAAGEGVPL